VAPRSAALPRSRRRAGHPHRGLRAAFDQLVKDPEFIAEAERTGAALDPTPGIEIQKISEGHPRYAERNHRYGDQRAEAVRHLSCPAMF
jgi:hypothetical protein